MILNFPSIKLMKFLIFLLILLLMCALLHLVNRALREKSLILFIADFIVVFFVVLSLWYKFFLPFSYYVGTISITIITIVSIIKCNSRTFLFIQLGIIFILIRCVYNVSMNFSLIPFGDGNWDYGVVKTFMADAKIYVIEQPPLLLLYSGWPLLHVFAMFLSSFSGIDSYTVALFLPYVIDFVLFMVVFLIFEEMRQMLGLSRFLTSIALLIYTVSPDSIFWQMQFVRQNLGVLLFAFVIYFLLRLINKRKSIRYEILLILTVFSLVMAHHFSSVIAVSFSILFLLVSNMGRFVFKKSGELPDPFLKKFLIITLGMLIFLLSWWNQVATMVFPYITDSINRLGLLFSGLRAFEVAPRRALFPQLLTPSWAVSLLLVRDILVYVPTFASFFIILFKTTSAHSKVKFFLVYSMFSFVSLLIMDNLIFRLGTTRILSMGLPFFAFLSAFFYYSFLKNSRILNHVTRLFIITTLLGLLLFSSFIGLWGHSFAPMHLYNPTIDSDEVGERSNDFGRVQDFTQKINFDNFYRVWADDRSPMLFLLEPEYFEKIEWIPVNNIDSLGTFGNEIVYILKDMNLYFYHAGVFSPVEDPSQADFIKESLSYRLEHSFNLVYTDGRNNVWMTTSETS